MANKPQEPRNMDDLYAAFEAADNIVLKKYVEKLSSAPCIRQEGSRCS